MIGWITLPACRLPAEIEVPDCPEEATETDEQARNEGTVSGFPMTVVGVGFGHTCALDPYGSPLCWGCDNTGIEWDSGGNDYPGFPCVPPPGTWRELAVVGGRSCFSADNGTVCTGLDFFEPPAPLERVSLGGAIYCGAGPAGTVCWAATTDDDLSDLQPEAGVEYSKTAADVGFACGIREGSIECWGPTSAENPPPQGIFKDIDSTYLSICALDDTGVRCWGTNPLPDVQGSWDHLTVGNEHACAYTSTDYTCWGATEYGPTEPIKKGIIMMDAGYTHTCAVRGDGRIECWGDPTYGAIYPP